MPTIMVPEETYQRLSRLAAALSTTVDAIAKPALEQLATDQHENGSKQTNPNDMQYEEWKKRFDAHMKIVESRADRYPPGHVTDCSRESIYEGCGE